MSNLEKIPLDVNIFKEEEKDKKSKKQKEQRDNLTQEEQKEEKELTPELSEQDVKEIRETFEITEKTLESLPKTELAKQTIIEEEMSLMERLREKTRKIAGVFILMTVLSAMPKQAEAGPADWIKGAREKIEETVKNIGESIENTGQRVQEKIKNIQELRKESEKNEKEQQELDKIEIGEQWEEARFEGQKRPEWLMKGNFFEDEKNVYCIGMAEVQLDALARAAAGGRARSNIVEQAKLKIKQGIENPYPEGTAEQEYFNKIVDIRLNQATAEGINIIGSVPIEYYTQQVYEKVGPNEVKFLHYKTFVLMRQSKECFDFVYEQLKQNCRKENVEKQTKAIIEKGL